VTTTSPVTSAPARSGTTSPSTPWLRHVLLLDAGVGVVSGLAVAALATPLAAELDAPRVFVVVLGLLFVVAGIVNGWAARRSDRLPTLLAVEFDLVGAAIAGGLLLWASPTGIGTALLVLTAVWTAGIAVVKLAGLRAARE
jgi:uncharacterized membrane protein HdeD (DUF308 family)